MEFLLTPNFYQKSKKWLLFFTLICGINAVLLLFIDGKFFTFAMFLPFIHCGIIWICLIFYSILNYGKGDSNKYIKENYPEIWKKLHPGGDSSQNSFTGFKFLKGKYDDGKDEKLNNIKKNMSNLNKLILWVFFLIPISWIVNIGMFLWGRG